MKEEQFLNRVKKAQEEKNIPSSIYLPEHYDHKLKRLATESGLSRSKVVMQLLDFIE